MMVSIMTTKNPDDLDTFLLGIESKLRLPFTSLDLSKTIQNSNLSSADSHVTTPDIFLKNTLLAFNRMAKPIKLRILVTLLCIEGCNQEQDLKVVEVLDMAENDEDEWVRILAGIVRGKMYYEIDDSTTNGSRKSSRSKETDSLLKKTTEGILKECLVHAAEAEKQAREAGDDSGEEREEGEEEEGNISMEEIQFLQDRAPLYVPFKYCLLDPEKVRCVLPESFENIHFTVEQNADILKVDKQKEERQAEDERKEKKSDVSISEKTGAAALQGKNRVIKNVVHKKANLFVKPKTKNASISMVKKGISQGGGKGRKSLMGNSVTPLVRRSFNTTTSSRVRPDRGATIMQAKARMRMPDPDDEEEFGKKNMNAKKRRILAMAEKSGLKKSSSSLAGRGVSSASTSQFKNNAKTDQKHDSKVEQLLQSSNKITPEDKKRVELFFTTQYNATPDVKLYKMKLNEEKKSEPDGTLVKETIYLELDYNNFSVKKLKKIKRY